MKERKVDLFKTIYEDGVDAICITTNGNYSPVSGLAAMGGGCAGICARRWPETAKRLGKMLKMFMTNVPYVIGALDEDGNTLELTKDTIKNKNYKCLIFSYPTINNLIDGANIQLIKQSAAAIVDYADKFDLKNIIIPRPGCGIGSMDYYKEVRPELIKILDDRFTVVSFEHED